MRTIVSTIAIKEDDYNVWHKCATGEEFRKRIHLGINNSNSTINF